MDALIQLSELCKVGEDHAIAAELIERAIYALENAFHPSFGICRGDCRLNYLRQENRFALLIQILERRIRKPINFTRLSSRQIFLRCCIEAYSICRTTRLLSYRFRTK